MGNAFVVSDGDDDLSAVGVKCINQAKNLLPQVINESIVLVQKQISPDVDVDWVNFCFMPNERGLGKKLMVGITNVPTVDDSFFESSIVDGTMKKGSLVLHYIVGV